MVSIRRVAGPVAPLLAVPHNVVEGRNDFRNCARFHKGIKKRRAYKQARLKFENTAKYYAKLLLISSSALLIAAPKPAAFLPPAVAKNG